MNYNKRLFVVATDSSEILSTVMAFGFKKVDIYKDPMKMLRIILHLSQ